MKKNIASAVHELLEEPVLALGYVIWDVTYEKIGSEPNLTVTIDNNEGITIEDCEKVHRAIDPLLDEADLIEDAYRLNVSSPGIERELRTDFHITSCVGDTVEIKTFAPKDGRRVFCGKLTAYDGETLTIAEDTACISIPRRDAAKIETKFDFDAE